MDFRSMRETITTGEEVFAKNCEQSVELDYILPDYYPDIFRLVKCTLNPSVVSQSVSGDKIIFELCVEITVWYCDENAKTLQTISQKLNYSKTIDANTSAENALIKIKPECDYVNSRAVNQRRLDIRGAVNCMVNITKSCEQNVICDATGGGIQLLKTQLCAASENSFLTKSFLAEDEFDLGVSKPAALSIVRSEAIITSIDKKTVSGKLVAKGDVGVNLLYLADDGASNIESMQFSIPFSQIIDLKNSESDECMIDAECVSCDISIASNDEGEQKKIKCSVMICVNAFAQKSRDVQIVTDAYSTEYQCSVAECEICIDSAPIRINELHSEKETIGFDSQTAESICGVWASAKPQNTRIENGLLIISGKIKWSVLAKTLEGYSLFEKETVFEHNLSDFGDFENLRSDISAAVISCSYNLSNQQNVSLKADIRLSGCVIPNFSCKALTDITIDESSKEMCQDNCALKLYFANEGEKLWDIAKKYKTSAEAAAQENGIDSASDSVSGMLMIPMVSN